MKIIRGAVRIASSQPRREITIRTLAQSYAVNVWAERLDTPNPFLENFDPDKAVPLRLPSETAAIPCHLGTRRTTRIELHA
jgi:hypothetical protein